MSIILPQIYKLANATVYIVGIPIQSAVEQALDFMKSRVKGAGGVICINAGGETAHHFTTERMAWAIAKADVLSWGLDPNERNEEQLC